ncbi:response regulator transcription factor [Telluria mixta]|uniref:Response regulator transcription factor n=1 Tax=Telluria mixta TaxID=34071 RepID=A0ABT2C755_9BURK|nr:response regulator transcription factor [Telluria mixta]MCS0632509.1 response regulator transcription factor [Telluria mixta]WEM99195.1 response regulator transcription factor [Telluria mixta]
MQLLMADCDDLAREGIHSVVSRISANVSINEARTFIKLIEALSLRKYDLVIVEPLAIGKNVAEVIKHIRAVAPESKILIFSQLNEMTHGALSIAYGAKGFLMKNCSIEEFVTAVRRIEMGRVYVGAALASQLATSSPHRSGYLPHDSLTEKEKLVYSMLVCGMRVVEVSKTLNLSQKTISTHKSRILSKFRLQSFADLLNYTIAYGLIDECRLRVKNFNNKT